MDNYYRAKADVDNLREKLQKAEQLAEKIYKDKYSVKVKTKEELIASVWKLPELSAGCMEILEDNGFITGSSVLSSKSYSDIDWCVNLPPIAFKGYVAGYDDQGYWEADGFSAVYGHKGGFLYNIICFSDSELMKAWEFTTKILKYLSKVDYVFASSVYHKVEFNESCFRKLMSEKWMRVRLFRAFKDILHPVKLLKEYHSYDDAIKYRKCRYCGREALNFMDKPSREIWENTGQCERCRHIVRP